MLYSTQQGQLCLKKSVHKHAHTLTHKLCAEVFFFPLQKLIPEEEKTPSKCAFPPEYPGCMKAEGHAACKGLCLALCVCLCVCPYACVCLTSI